MTPNAAPAPHSPERVWLWLCAGILLVAAAIRIPPAFGDLWLDEIWTWNSVRALDGASGVFDRIHHSNNHHLNSLLFYWIGDRASALPYRLPSLAAGIASVALAGALGCRHGRLEGVLAASAVGLCYALVYFASEARGYALAVGFALAAAWLLARAHERGGAAATAAFGACTVLGLLANLTFLFFVAGAFAVSLARLVRRREAPARAAAQLAALYAPVALALAALAWVDLRDMKVGAGDPWSFALLASRTLGFSLGLPVAEALAWPGLALAAAIGLAAGRLSWRAGDEDWLLVLVTAVAAPALVLGVMRPAVLEVRYFVIGIALYLLLASRLAAAWLRAGGIRRALAVAGLAAFALGNAAHLAPFLRFGRGGYAEAVRFMAESSPGDAFTVGSDHDFRTGMVLRYYARGLPAGRSLVYTPHAELPESGPEWLILHAPERPARVLPVVADAQGHQYRLAREFPSGGISGFWWGVYRNAAAAPARG